MDPCLPPDHADAASASALIKALRSEMARVLVGREALTDSLLAALIAGGHILLEGVPGIAKTLAARALAAASGLKCSRIQFTSDLLPADVSGTLVYDQGSRTFSPRPGPVFANIVVADEINRAPAKVQCALLEAMEEGRVTIGEESLTLPDPFMVLATQNPIEHEGTYPLPEAELDRFMAKVIVGYPDAAQEAAIVAGADARAAGLMPRPVCGPEGLNLLRAGARVVRVDPALLTYMIALVRATRPARDPRKASAKATGAEEGGLGRYLEYGASPRASIALHALSRARALMDGRSAVLPDDIRACSRDVLRHRLVLSYEAEAEGLDAEDILEMALAAVPAP